MKGLGIEGKGNSSDRCRIIDNDLYDNLYDDR